MKSQENGKFQCLRLLKSYACSRSKECYECRKLEHRELLESYERMFQIRVFAPIGRVSILQTANISQIKHMATSQNTLQHTSIRGVQEDICVLILVHVLQIGRGAAPPPNPPLFRNASTMPNKTIYERSRSQRVLIFVHVFQMGGGCAPRNPPAICNASALLNKSRSARIFVLTFLSKQRNLIILVQELHVLTTFFEAQLRELLHALYVCNTSRLPTL